LRRKAFIGDFGKPKGRYYRYNPDLAKDNTERLAGTIGNCTGEGLAA
jgi:hypothetical protein